MYLLYLILEKLQWQTGMNIRWKSMREKIKQLAKENFQYELPEIVLSKDTIELSVEAGKLYEDSLFIRNQENSRMKGLIYCTCPYVKTDNKSFSGRETRIGYSVCVRGEKAGETITGDLHLVTDCGEKIIPIILKVVKNYVSTSLGEIRDLFQFTNLAKMNPKEAVRLFVSPEFKNVFFKKDAPEMMLYQSLIKSTSPSHAMEEFLISIHKKRKIVINVEKNSVTYEKTEESFSDKVILTKDTWGYEEIIIRSNAEFLRPTVDKVWTDEFAGGQYELEYIIEPEYITAGTNYGRIEIITTNQICKVDVIIKNAEERENTYSKRQIGILELIHNYLKFRLGQIDSENYITEGKKLLESHDGELEPFWQELLALQLAFAEGNEEECKRQIEFLQNHESEIKNTSEVTYCGYWYLKALVEGTKETIEQAVLIAEVCYQQTRKWQILWMLLYLDKKYEIAEVKLQAILEQLEAGCYSPVLYYELCTLYNQEPIRLKELTRENIAALHWGIKMNYISENLALQYVLLAGKMSKFHKIVYHDMEVLYGIYETDDILHGICAMLVRNEKAGREYFPWYRSGVRKQLKLTNLYEYYMYSLDEQKRMELPQNILQYFLYDSRLNDKKRAFLYAYIVRNKDKNEATFINYEKQIRRFALQQLEKENNDENLSVLYDEVFGEDFFNEKLLNKMVKIMFQYQIICNDKRMKGVCILHRELEQEEYVPLEKNKAIISLYTEGAQFVFIDEAGRRFANVEDYSVKKLNHLEQYMETCYQMGDRSAGLLISLCEKIGNYHKKKEDSEVIRKETIQLDCINDAYRRSLYRQLMEFYYDNMQNEELEALLQDANLIVPEEAESRVIELSMIYCLEKQSMEALRKHGWEKVPVNRIQKFMTLLFMQNGMDEKDEQLLELAYHVFDSGKCNKTLLKYLAIYYQGPASSMLSLWERCVELQDETEEGIEISGYLEQIEEEILCKILFAENGNKNYYPVFQSYYKRGYKGQEYEKREKRQLIKAYLAYTAYRYVLHDEEVDEQLFEMIQQEIVSEELEIGRIALLKHYSEKKVLTEKEKQFVDFQISEFVGKNIIFPFFAKFRDRVVVPQRVSGKYYVEYHANPKKKVYISYAFAKKEGLKFVTEPMKQIYPGIFVKELILFYNEELEYYIFEEEQGKKTITQSDSVTLEGIPEDTGENKQNLLNVLLLALEMQDDKTLLAGMEDYIKRKHADNLFKPL